MQPGWVRIIGGKWRRKRLRIPDIKGLRPTPDRVRETLFNWLAPLIQEAHCLDPFAGSGALGFEALSRGAAYVEMTDESALAITSLQEELATFELDDKQRVQIYRARAPEQLHIPKRPFDIVFLDPPYDGNHLLSCCAYLEQHFFLASTAYIYLEARQTISDNDLPLHWHLIKSGKAGQVHYHLAKREGSA